MAYKIFPKFLVTRLTACLRCIISLEKDALLLGKSIFKNITLAQEMAHSLNKKVAGRNAMPKNNMSKTYDRAA